VTRAMALIAALVLAMTGHAIARGGGRGGGFARGGGFSRGGVAAGGSFGHRSAGGGTYGRPGPAASGTFAGRSSGRLGDRHGGGDGEGAMRPDAGDREARRDERQERRQEAREDWQDYADDHYDDHYYGEYYPHGAAVVAGVAAAAAARPPYWTLDCVPTVVVVSGTTYYRCDSGWYVRVYSGGEIAYTMVNPPAGY